MIAHLKQYVSAIKKVKIENQRCCFRHSFIFFSDILKCKLLFNAMQFIIKIFNNLNILIISYSLKGGIIHVAFY